MDVRGKTAIVAGGAGSLGCAIVDALLERGARVGVFDLRAGDRTHGDLRYEVADLSSEDAVTQALDRITAAFGSVHVLINCAGLIHSEPLINLTAPATRRHRLATWDATIRSNLTATFVTTSVVAEHMALSRTKGAIVNFSSIAAAGNPGQTAYAAAKAGVDAMTVVWARELGPLGIRAVAIAPGFVLTESTQAALSEDALAQLKRRTPLLRLGKTAEIVSAVLFAVENDFVTGTTIAVDGGLVL